VFIVTSDFAATPIVPANSHGPYLVVGGGPVLLSAGVAHPHSSYHWELGDGTTSTTPDVTHRYGHSGVYVAKLTVAVSDPGGAVTRHFAVVNVQNVPPAVDAGGARTVNEGDVVAFSASFTDPQWLDTHTASWDWGDSQARTDGVVVESHNEPQGTGTVAASHAWGDAGSYVAVLTVRDDAGGVGQAQVPITVLNVAPTVDAGAAMYAYPCCVITLSGTFIDPGWLDRHIGFWDFGDCSGRQTAVLRETNEPPRAEGVVIASHVFERCGVYTAICSVMDDDGAFGVGQTVVRVVDVVNRTFEHGFHGSLYGSVANGWIEYLGTDSLDESSTSGAAKAPLSGAGLFVAEEMLVHAGERAQRIRFEGSGNAGIYQHVGANPGWDYQITAWYTLHPQAGGTSQPVVDENEVPPDPVTAGVARLGIDPSGGTDASASTVVWCEGRMRGEWSQLAVRATARARRITVFLEGVGGAQLKTDVAFDDVALVAVQPFCPDRTTDEPPPPPATETRCVDFAAVQERQVPPDFTKDGFTFLAGDKQPQSVVSWGDPPGVLKLLIRTTELIVLPFVANRVDITVFAKTPLYASALDAARQTIAQAQTAGSGLETLRLEAEGIVDVLLTARGGENVIVKVCASRASTAATLQTKGVVAKRALIARGR